MQIDRYTDRVGEGEMGKLSKLPYTNTGNRSREQEEKIRERDENKKG